MCVCVCGVCVCFNVTCSAVFSAVFSSLLLTDMAWIWGKYHFLQFDGKVPPLQLLMNGLFHFKLCKELRSGAGHTSISPFGPQSFSLFPSCGAGKWTVLLLDPSCLTVKSERGNLWAFWSCSALSHSKLECSKHHIRRNQTHTLIHHSCIYSQWYFPRT